MLKTLKTYQDFTYQDFTYQDFAVLHGYSITRSAVTDKPFQHLLIMLIKKFSYKALDTRENKYLPFQSYF